MIEAVISSLVESVTALLLGKMISVTYKKRHKDKSKGLLPQHGEIEEASLTLGGELGKSLLTAYSRFRETRDTKAIEEYLKEAACDDEITFLVEISRRAENDVRIQLGRRIEYAVSSIKEISPDEFPSLAESISAFIQTINTIHKGPKIHLILSMPVVLGFQIGQLVGLSHYNIELYHFERGRYLNVPYVKRG